MLKGKNLIKYALLSTIFSIGFTYTQSCVSIGNGGNDNTNNAPTNTQTISYSIYTEAQSNASYHWKQSLYILDPETGNAKLLSDKIFTDSEETVFISSVDAQNKLIKDMYDNYQFLISEEDGDMTERNGGKFYKVALKKDGNTNPQLNQVSNLTDICFIKNRYHDDVNGKYYFSVQTAGDDGKCGNSDDKYYFINSDMSSTTSPISLDSLNVLAQYSGRLFAIDGFIVYDENSGNVSKCDTNLANCKTLTTISTSSSTANYHLGFNPNNPSINYFCLNNKIYKIDTKNETANDTGESCPYWSRVSQDENYIYIADLSTSDEYKIYKYDLANDKSTLLYTGTYSSSSEFVDFEGITNNYIIVSIFSNSSQTYQKLKIIAINKNTGSSTEIENRNLERYHSFRFVSFYNDKFVYNLEDDNRTNYACYWKEGDNNTTCTSNSTIIAEITNGSQFNYTFNAHIWKDWADTSNNRDYVVVEGTTLYLVDGDNLDNQYKLADIPNGYTPSDFTVFYELSTKYLPFTLEKESVDKNDVFLLQGSSLKQITNTDDKDEIFIEK